jgi:chemotaxis protein MotB
MAKKKHHHEEHVDESWLIPYADLLTLLLALFIVLFASSKMDAKKFETLSHALNSAFNGGTGVMEHPSPMETPIAPSPDKPVKKPGDQSGTGSTGADQQQEQQKQQAEEKRLAAEKQETENLKELQKKINQYINQNALEAQFETKLLPEGLKIVINDLAFFQSGRAEIRPEAKPLGAALSQLLALYPRKVSVSGHTDNVPISNSTFESNWDLSSKRAINFMKILLENGKLDPKNFSATGFGEYQPVAPNDTDAGRAKNRRVEVFILRQ